jgi:hypothetical protein
MGSRLTSNGGASIGGAKNAGASPSRARLSIRRRRPAAFQKRMRRQRRGLRARSQRGATRGKSKGSFRK